MGEKRGSVHNVVKYVTCTCGNDPSFKHERTLLIYAVLTFIALMALQAIAYLVFYSKYPAISEASLPLVVLLNAGVVASAYASYHFKLLRQQTEFTCMAGMMIGMTIGMMAGFMAGALLGATNGMFYGSVVGMFAGIGIGLLLGKESGIMGAMEGMMAGIMSGTMGAMLSVMLISDHLMPFLYILFPICIFLLGGMSYMMYKEEGNIKANSSVTLLTFFTVCLIVSLFFSWFMFFGPKSGIFIGIGVS